MFQLVNIFGQYLEVHCVSSKTGHLGTLFISSRAGNRLCPFFNNYLKDRPTFWSFKILSFSQ